MFILNSKVKAKGALLKDNLKTMNFVTCNLIGPGGFSNHHNYGLGNQLFLVATVLSYAKENNLTPIFPDMKNKKYGNYTSNIFQKLNTTEIREDEIECEYFEPSFTFNKIPKKNNIRINGYFQSEKYFIENRDLVLQNFLPDNIYMQKLYSKYNNLIDESSSCHIRLGDYEVLEDFHANLHKTNYFNNAFQKVKSKKIVIFSDDIDNAKKLNFSTSKELLFIETASDVEDLYLMSLFKESIISNSTFSWWAAWLNTNDNKKIIYPDKWFGVKNKYETKDLVPNQWEKCLVK